MGWSCRREAGVILDKWIAACVAQTGSQNTFKVGNKEYFFETSNVEHRDGAITGAINVMLPNNMCKKCGSFRIEGNGTITKAPKFLKLVGQ